MTRYLRAESAAHSSAAHSSAAHPSAAHSSAAHPSAAHPSAAHPSAAHPSAVVREKNNAFQYLVQNGLQENPCFLFGILVVFGNKELGRAGGNARNVAGYPEPNVVFAFQFGVGYFALEHIVN